MNEEITHIVPPEEFRRPHPTECFCIPGEHSMIDTIDPQTNRGSYGGRSLEEIGFEYPGAVRMSISDWVSSRVERQDTEIEWKPVLKERYEEMLNVLPPEEFTMDGFLVSEPVDHHARSGKPRYAAFIRRCGEYFESSRPLTVEEFIKIQTR